MYMQLMIIKQFVLLHVHYHPNLIQLDALTKVLYIHLLTHL